MDLSSWRVQERDEDFERRTITMAMAANHLRNSTRISVHRILHHRFQPLLNSARSFSEAASSIPQPQPNQQSSPLSSLKDYELAKFAAIADSWWAFKQKERICSMNLWLQTQHETELYNFFFQRVNLFNIYWRCCYRVHNFSLYVC